MSSNGGINDTPFVDTWHGKLGDALPPQHSSAGNNASGLIAGLPSRPYSARNTSACSCCVAVHRRMPCRFGVIADHLPPRPTKSLTQRSSVIPSGIVVCRYHKGGVLNKTIDLVVAWVEGISPMLPILEGGRCACHFVFGLHSLLWQHWNYALGPGGHCFHPTSHPTQLPQLFNACTTPTLIRLLRSTSHNTQLPQLFNAHTALTLIRLLRSGSRSGCSCPALDGEGDLFLDEVFFFGFPFFKPIIFFGA
jgi:hypothetical protein